MIKLIASDMDGTLLNSNKQLSPSLYGVLKKLNDKGIVFVENGFLQYIMLIHLNLIELLNFLIYLLTVIL